MYVDSNSDNESDTEPVHEGFGLYQNGDDSHNKVKPIKVKVAVGHCDITMDVDTGVSRSMISENVYRNYL